MNRGKKLLVKMVRELLTSELKAKITDSFKAEPENERVEFYYNNRRGAAITVLALTVNRQCQQADMYPELGSLDVEFYKRLEEMLRLIGFYVFEYESSQ